MAKSCWLWLLPALHRACAQAQPRPSPWTPLPPGAPPPPLAGPRPLFGPEPLDPVTVRPLDSCVCVCLKSMAGQRCPFRTRACVSRAAPRVRHKAGCAGGGYYAPYETWIDLQLLGAVGDRTLSALVVCLACDPRGEDHGGHPSLPPPTAFLMKPHCLRGPRGQRLVPGRAQPWDVNYAPATLSSPGKCRPSAPPPSLACGKPCDPAWPGAPNGSPVGYSCQGPCIWVKGVAVTSDQNLASGSCYMVLAVALDVEGGDRRSWGDRLCYFLAAEHMPNCPVFPSVGPFLFEDRRVARAQAGPHHFLPEGSS